MKNKELGIEEKSAHSSLPPLLNLIRLMTIISCSYEQNKETTDVIIYFENLIA